MEICFWNVDPLSDPGKHLLEGEGGVDRSGGVDPSGSSAGGARMGEYGVVFVMVVVVGGMGIES